jgi:DNA mismatch endonuclease (patch repair protein)
MQKKEINNVIKVPRFNFQTTKKSSLLMGKIRSSNTKAEVILRKVVWKCGLRYRLNYKKIAGKPDMIFISKKLIVFVDGDFWHGYKWEEKKPKLKSNKEYWIPKIERNIQRDNEINLKLEKDGWKVLRFWEHEVIKSPQECVSKILLHM